MNREYQTDYVLFEDSVNMVTSNRPPSQNAGRPTGQHITEIEIEDPSSNRPNIDLNEGNQPVIIHHVESSNRHNFNHIEDLDKFFTNVYNYHQQGGMLCILIKNIGDLIQFSFVVFFTLFVWKAVDYESLSEAVVKKSLHSNGTFILVQKGLSDIILPYEDIRSQFGWISITILSFTILYFLTKTLYSIVKCLRFYDIKKFYNVALKIEDKDLPDYYWEEIQTKVLEVQVSF